MRVIKFGGSLLGIGGVADRFERWRGLQSPMASLVVVGGGATADIVRELDRVSHLEESTAHWLAIRAMQFNAHLVAALLPEAKVMESFDQPLADGNSLAVWVADPWSLLRENSPGRSDSLPESWDVTSDSIAAWLAVGAKATELVLLKSAIPGGERTVHHAVESGYVDRHFPHAAQALTRIRCVNLRDESFPEIEFDPRASTPSRSLVVPPPTLG